MTTSELDTSELKSTNGGEAWCAAHAQKSRAAARGGIPRDAFGGFVSRVAGRFIEVKSDFENRRKALKDLSRQPSIEGADDTVPAAAALSFREAADALQFAMTQRSGRNSPGLRRPGGGAAVVPVEPAIDDPTDEELFSAMQGQWVEVECLLRVQLRGETALEEAVSDAPAPRHAPTLPSPLTRIPYVPHGSASEWRRPSRLTRVWASEQPTAGS